MKKKNQEVVTEQKEKKIKPNKKEIKKEKAAKKPRKNKKEKLKNLIIFLDKNRKAVYGFVAGILITAIVATLIWPERIATLSDGTQPVAEINGEKITANALYDDMKKQYQVSMLLNIVDDMILSEMYEETDEMKENVEKSAQNFYSQAESYYQMTKEQFLSQNGLASHEEFLEFLKLDYRRNEYFQSYVKSLVKDKEIEKYYEDKVYGDIDSKHMLVAIGTDMKDEDAKKLANEIISKLNEGKSFDEVKEEYKDKITYEELGYQPFNANLQESYMTAIKNLENGKYTTEPVATTYGYHVIYRIDQKEKPSLEDIKDEIIDTLAEEKENEDKNLYNKSLIKLREDKEFKFFDTALEDKYKDLKKSVE